MKNLLKLFPKYYRSFFQDTDGVYKRLHISNFAPPGIYLPAPSRK